MLKNLYLKNFTIISELSLDFSSGFTVLTGETGAGKSILIDALEIVLGERADSAVIKIDSDRCEISAHFEVKNILPAQQWLREQALDEDADDETRDNCFIRRIMSRDGKSRALINGRPVSLQQVRELGTLLIHIHGQNKHSLLMKSSYQRQLLDEFAQHTHLCDAVCDDYAQWQQAQRALDEVQRIGQDHTAQRELLAFQLQEIAQLSLREQEWQQLSEEQQQLAHASSWADSCQQVLNMLVEDEQLSASRGLHMAHQQLRELAHRGAQVASALELIDQALIQVQEAGSDVRHYLNTLEPDPKRLEWLEQRLALIHDLARKHKIAPEQLPLQQQRLQEQVQQLSQLDERVQALTEKIAEYAAEYVLTAQALTSSRRQAAAQLNQKITFLIRALGILHGEFAVQLTPYPIAAVRPHGDEQIEFVVTTNPGQPLQPLRKIASGGEMSRMALAIQVATVQQHTLPTVIFDEVDVGIGGSTAQVVGQELKKLGENAQVLCVTHQPQVAAQGHVHLRVRKWIEQGAQHSEAKTAVDVLTLEERAVELARMLGGVKVTEATLAHAREMLNTV